MDRISSASSVTGSGKVVSLFVPTKGRGSTKGGRDMKTVLVPSILLLLVFQFHLTDGKCFGDFCLNGNYEKCVPPAKPTNVNITLFLFEIFEVDDVNNHITIDLMIRLNWVDNRITLKQREDNFTRSTMGVPDFSGDVDLDIVEEIWKPLLVIRHLKKEESRNGLFHTPILLNILDREGSMQMDLWMQSRPTVTCNMEFFWYPFDTQECELLIQSVASKDKLSLSFPKQFQLDKMFKNNFQNVQLKYYVSVEHVPGEGEMKAEYMDGTNKEFATTGLTVILRRRWTRYFFTYYVPSSLCVVVSWASFFIPLKVLAARNSLLVTLFLSLTTILASSIINTPGSSELMTVLTLWILVHYIFICGEIGAYAVLICHSRWSDMEEEEHEEYTRKRDWVAILVLVPAYIVFNVIYWCVIVTYL